MEQMWLDVLYIVPAGIPPHKAADVTASPLERLAMCERAFSSLDGVIISDMELRREGKSYTVDTLQALHDMCEPDSRLFLLLGTDMLLTLDHWYRPDEIFRLSYPVYMRREAADPILDARIVKQIELLRDRYGKVVRRVVGDALPISSTQVRTAVAQGRSIDHLVPHTVAQYIRDHKLYV